MNSSFETIPTYCVLMLKMTSCCLSIHFVKQFLLFWVEKNCLTLAESFYYVRQLLIVNYYIKRQSNKLSEHWRFFVFKTKCELKCPNELFLNCHFSGNTSVSVFIIEIIWQNFDVIIDDPQLMIHNWCSRKTLLQIVV